MLKGIMRSNIFENNQDEAFFLNLYIERGVKGSFKVIGYGLMNTHLHLLLLRKRRNWNKHIEPA